MYMLGSLHASNGQINRATFFRISEYPAPCIQVLLSEVEKPDGFTAYQSRCIHLRGLFNLSIVEYPDRAGRQTWSPRRFAYGARRLVWKEGDPKDDVVPQTLHEFSHDWAKPRSKTGKRLDDANPGRLAWVISQKLEECWERIPYTLLVAWTRFSKSSYSRAR